MSDGFRSLLAFWLGGGASTAATPVVVVPPVGRPEQPERQHFAPIRGKGRAQLRRLSAAGSGSIIAGAQRITGRGGATLGRLRVAGTGIVFTPIVGSGGGTLAPLAMAGRGRVPMLFYEDEVAAILAAMR